jgi:hypothetical protein
MGTVLGGDYSEESGKADWDHSTPWLRHLIENIWKADLLVVQRQLTLVGVTGPRKSTPPPHNSRSSTDEPSPRSGTYRARCADASSDIRDAGTRWLANPLLPPQADQPEPTV